MRAKLEGRVYTNKTDKIVFTAAEDSLMVVVANSIRVMCGQKYKCGERCWHFTVFRVKTCPLNLLAPKSITEHYNHPIHLVWGIIRRDSIEPLPLYSYMLLECCQMVDFSRSLLCGIYSLADPMGRKTGAKLPVVWLSCSFQNYCSDLSILSYLQSGNPVWNRGLSAWLRHIHLPQKARSKAFQLPMRQQLIY